MGARNPRLVRTIQEGDSGELQEGRCFHATAGISTLNQGGNLLDLGYTVGAGRSPRVRFALEVAVASALDVQIFEGAAFTGGTAVVAYNRKRTSAQALSDAIVHTPTVSDTGTAIYTGALWSNGTGAIVLTDPRYEFILRPATAYLFRVTNNGAAAVRIVNGLYIIDTDGLPEG